jgi:hypothetical protein
MTEEEFLELIDPTRTSANMVLHEMMKVVWELETEVGRLSAVVNCLKEDV